MRVINYISILLLLILAACVKKPQASFKTDKTVYRAGDTVKLTNTSPTGSSFIWGFPDDHTETNKDALYPIDTDHWFDEISFNLTTKSKGHKKTDQSNLAVKVIPRSSYTIRNVQYNTGGEVVPNTISITNTSGNFILSTYNSYGKGSQQSIYEVIIYFPPGNYPAAGTYTLQNSNANLSNNKAMINWYGGSIDAPGNSYFVNGFLTVEYIENTMHINFSDVTTNAVLFSMDASLYYYMK